MSSHELIGGTIALLGLVLVLFSLGPSFESLWRHFFPVRSTPVVDPAADSPPEPGGPLAERAVRLACSHLLRAWRHLDATETYDKPDQQKRRQDAWKVFNKRLSEYKESALSLHSTARDNIGAIVGALEWASRRRDVAGLARPMADMKYAAGDLLLNVKCRDVEAEPFAPKTARGRRVIVTLSVSNMEKYPVNLTPQWWLETQHEIFTPFSADGVPLEEWGELLRQGGTSPSVRPLPMPLRLGPTESTFGYWSFLVDDLFERNCPGAYDHEMPSSFITLFDQTSDKGMVSRRVGFQVLRLRRPAKD